VEPPTESATAFVCQLWIHGLPYSKTRALGPQATNELLPILTDPAREDCHGMAASALGILADPVSTGPLVAFIRSGAGVLTRKAFSARSGAVSDLGYLVNGSGGDPAALDFLLEGTSPTAWESIAWQGPSFDTKAEQNDRLARMAVTGLVLSGTPAAGEKLQEIGAGSSDLASHARGLIEEYEKVRDLGLPATTTASEVAPETRRAARFGELSYLRACSLRAASSSSSFFALAATASRCFCSTSARSLSIRPAWRRAVARARSARTLGRR
jgi:hypothetical protein